MHYQQRFLEEIEIIRWALANRQCKITAVPHWVIMALMEDIVHFECNLIESLVMALDKSQEVVLQNDCLERATENLMTSVLLASLHEDGYIEITADFLEDPYFFDFHHQFSVQITLTPSGEDARVWEELEVFTRNSHAVLQ